MNTFNTWFARTLTVLAVTLSFNCGGSGPTNPPAGCEPNCPPEIQIFLTEPVAGLTIMEGDTIFCDGLVEIIPPATGIFPEWWIKGENEWMKARGDSLLCFCAHHDGTAESGRWVLRYWFAGNLAQPPADDYTVNVHARGRGQGVGNRGPILVTENRPIHILPRAE